MTLELARVVDADDRRCTVAFVAGARLAQVTLSANNVRYGVLGRPGHLVLVADNVVIFRGPLEGSVGAHADLDMIREQCTAELQALAARGVSSGDPQLWLYPIDSRTLAHAEVLEPASLNTTVDEQWLDRSPEHMADEFELDARRRLPLVLGEVRALPNDGAPILVEGSL